MTPKPKRGGKRPGAGRPKGPAERKAKSYSVTLPMEAWEQIDAIRGELSRSHWVASKIQP